MSALSDKVSYLRGLAEGLKLDSATNEGKLIAEIIDALNLASEKLDALDEGFEELSDYVECIDDDLEALEVRVDEEEEDDDDFDFDEDDFDEDEDDEDEEFVDEDEPCHCEDCEDCEGCEDECDESFGMYVGCLCSECGGMFSVDVNFDEDQLFICPHCGKRVKAVQMNCHNVPVAETTTDEDK